MKTHRLLIFSLLLIISACSLRAQGYGCISSAQLDTYISRMMEANHLSGVAANIVKNGELVWQGVYGESVQSGNRPVTNETSFLLYSMTKTITGVALLKILDTKGISPDDPIQQFLPFDLKHPLYPDLPISFRMLMGHVSGIRDNWSVINQVYSYDEDPTMSTADFLRAYLHPDGEYYDANLNFGSRPGTGFSYSNVNAALAGYLIERLSGVSFTDYVEQEILKALSMTHSHFLLEDIDPADLATQYSWQNNSWQPARHLSSPLIPAGFLHATNSDLVHWLKFASGDGSYLGTRILKAETMDALFRPAYPDIEPATGLFSGFDPLYGVWGHTGGVSGIRTCYFIQPDEDWGISVLTNGAGDPYPIFYFIMQAAREYLPLSVQCLTLNDPDQDGIPEPGERVVMDFQFKNNTMMRLGEVEVRLTSDDPDIVIFEGNSLIEGSTPGMVVPLRESLIIDIRQGALNHNAGLELEFFENGWTVGQAAFSLPLGKSRVLLVNDEHHPQKNMARSINRYSRILDELGVDDDIYDVSLRGSPKIELLKQFETLYWMTGLDNLNHEIMTEDEVEALSAYLDGGGNLFISGQNINDKLASSPFIRDYLHAESNSEAWTGSNRISGVAGTELGQGLSFSLSGGESNNTQYSPGALQPFGGAWSILNWFQSSQCCGIAFEGGFRLVYLSFGLEGVSDYAMAKTLVERAEIFFNKPSVVASDLSNPTFTIFPNPVNDHLHLTLKNAVPGKYLVSLFNLSGTCLGEIECINETGAISLSWPQLCSGHDFPPGIYNLMLESVSLRCGVKIVKL